MIYSSPYHFNPLYMSKVLLPEAKGRFFKFNKDRFPESKHGGIVTHL